MNETDFVESVLREFRSGFWWHRIPKNTKQMKDIETFLKEKLTEAMKEQKFEDNYENSKLSKKYTEMAYNNGRLAMKEEVSSLIEDRMFNSGKYAFTRGELRYILAAIRDMK